MGQFLSVLYMLEFILTHIRAATKLQTCLFRFVACCASKLEPTNVSFRIHVAAPPHHILKAHSNLLFWLLMMSMLKDKSVLQ